MIRYRRFLPHLQPFNATFFVTFRLTGTLPESVVLTIKAEYEAAKKVIDGHTIWTYAEKQEQLTRIQKIQLKRYEAVLDSCQYGHRWLQDKAVAEVVADHLHKHDNEKYQLVAYSIMPNHVHAIVRLDDEKTTFSPTHQGKTQNYPLADAFRLVKGASAKEANTILNRTGSFWHHESFDHFARSEAETQRMVAYVLHNPAKAGLCEHWHEWPFTYVNEAYGIAVTT